MYDQFRKLVMMLLIAVAILTPASGCIQDLEMICESMGMDCTAQREDEPGADTELSQTHDFKVVAIR